MTNRQAYITTTPSATLTDYSYQSVNQWNTGGNLTEITSLPLAPCRLSLSATTTVYLDLPIPGCNGRISITVRICCTGLAESGIMPPMKYWEMVADNLSPGSDIHAAHVSECESIFR